jgi:hypothetical protein
MRAISLLAAATGVLILAAGAGDADARERVRLSSCIGSKQDVLACCAIAYKPIWWWNIGASCRRELSCYPVKTKSGRKIEECRIRPRDIFFTPGF